MEQFSVAFTTTQDQIVQTIHRARIVEYGIITEVVDETHVKIALAVEKATISCRLATFTIKGISIKANPSEGDHCLILFPRLYHRDMWTAVESIESNRATGYDLLSGIAIPLRIFDEEALSTIEIGADGALAYSLKDENKNEKASISVASGGEVLINGHLKIKAKT